MIELKNVYKNYGMTRALVDVGFSIENGEIIGVALRTKAGMKPIYVSIGHKIELASALYWVGQCCRNYRMPEPTRLAHLAAGGNLVWQPDYQAKLFSV